MKNIEDKKLIAEFMGYEVYPDGYCDTKSVDETAPLPMLEYMFDSWDEIMPVIRHLRSTEEFNSIDFIPQGLGDEEMIKGLLTQDIESVYSGAVKFIKWYNAAANIKDKE